MARERAAHASQLAAIQAQIDATNARLSANLQHGIHVARVQFEHEFSIYKDIWGRLIDLRMVTMRLRPILDQAPVGEPREETIRKRLQAFAPALEAYREAVEKNKPFYAAEVYAKLDDVMDRCFQEKADYEHLERGTAEYFEEARENRRQIVLAVEVACESIRSRIANVHVVAS